MASRRDDLNAYTFAKRRTLAAFIQPSPTGSEEGAPKPLRAVVPGAVVGVVILAAFGAWGMFKPAAPPGWNKPGENIIIASKSTTRYVVLDTDGKRQLHPVLNMASAKLILDADKGQVINVDESVLDSGVIPHGVTIGIPYAPDRLPSAAEAGSEKRWAVCERPGDGGRAIQKAAFVFAPRERNRTEGKQRLSDGELLYVVGPDGTRYVVDAQGTRYRIPDDELLLRAVVGSGRVPERVSRDWLDTLHLGDHIAFPKIPGTPGAAANVAGLLDKDADKVGMVLRAPNNDKDQYYVVLPGRVAPISAFAARLLLYSKDLALLGQGGHPRDVSPGAISPGKGFATEHTWPDGEPKPVNDASASSGRDTVCSVLRHVDGHGPTTLSTWVGTDFPATLPTGSSSAYVTPGSGQLFRQFKGSDTKAGGVFLVTDTGLRYAMQSNSDSATHDSGIGTSAKQRKAALDETRAAQTRLGYAGTDPAPIPAEWSVFLPMGPRLSTTAARQPQGS
ncbi:type VII secretion protein EccB [Streptomyces sp. NPDC002004]